MRWTLLSLQKIRLVSVLAMVLTPFVVTGCASNHFGFDTGSKKKSSAYPLTERTCLMRAMYFESSRSSRDGMIAVGTVVMNRVNSTAYPKTICGVVGQPNQFAPGVLVKPMTEAASIQRVEEAADSVLRGERAKKSKNAMFFHTAGLKFPYKNMYYVQVAGGNAFYEKRARDGSLQVPVNDSPYDVAFAFAQERNGNAPKFTTPGQTFATVQPAPAAQPARETVLEPTMVATNLPSQQQEEMPVQMQQQSQSRAHSQSQAQVPIIVAKADIIPIPKPMHANVDQIHTGSVNVNYTLPSKKKIDEIGAVLQRQERTRRF